MEEAKETVERNFHVVMERMCKCAIRHNLPQIRSFETKDDAYYAAKVWANELNQVYCNNHGFGVVEVDDNFVISVGDGSY